MPSNHLYTSIFTKGGWTAPSWALSGAFFVILLVIFYFKYRNPIGSYGDIEIVQNLPDFWSAIDNENKEWTIKEEENARQNIGGMKIMLDKDFEVLQKATEQTQRIWFQTS